MIRTRAIPSALRRAALPTLASVLIVVAGCSDTSDVEHRQRAGDHRDVQRWCLRRLGRP